MNRKNSGNDQREQNTLQKQTTEVKTFNQDLFHINYQNTSKIYYHASSHEEDVKVNNYLCYQEGNKLIKITQILYEDRLIQIQDVLEINAQPERIKPSSISLTGDHKEKRGVKNIEKVRLFANDVKKNGKSEKRDKKNIVKNIVKIFISWLQKKNEERSGEEWKQSLSDLRKLLKNENFNNRLIKSISNNRSISRAFLVFLSDAARDEIKYSRIQDKESHLEAIELYISFLTEKSNEHEFKSEENSLFYDNSQSQLQNGKNNENNESEEDGKNVKNTANTSNSTYQYQYHEKNEKKHQYQSLQSNI